MRLLPVLATATALFALFAAAEFARHRGLPAAATRRLTHTVGAGTAALFPLYLTLAEVVLLAAAFTVFLTFTWMRHLLRSIHDIDRPTVGALIFPAGLLLTALVAWQRPAAFAYAALVLALADTAAATIGERLPSPTWKVAGGRKSLIGSLAFLAVALALGLAFTAASGQVSVLAALAAAVLLALVEASLGYGLDNLPVPILGGVLGEYVLML